MIAELDPTNAHAARGLATLLTSCVRKHGRSTIVAAIAILASGCTQQPVVSPPSTIAPAHAATGAKPDWFHQQIAAARAAKRAHQPKTDTVGAQQAYDDVMHTACTRAALAGPDKYPSRCDAILNPKSQQPVSDPCDENPDDPAIITECND